jgi:hypothetical protein
MSEVTAVPLRPIAKGSLVRLWVGIGLALTAAVGPRLDRHPLAGRDGTAGRRLHGGNGKRKGVVTTASGLQYQVLRKGQGPLATATDTAVVDYEGRLADGRTFDASARHGGPASLPVGRMIPGFTEGLQLMNPGAKYRLWIPPELGYGASSPDESVIPNNAMLIFDVDLLGVVPAPTGMPGLPPQMQGMPGQ